MTSKEVDDLLKSISSIFPKTKINVITSTSKIRWTTLYHFDNPEKANALYHTDILQTFMQKMHHYARTFVQEYMASSISTFDALYPNHNPRYCFVNMYSKDTKEGVPLHRDQVSFVSIVVALQGDINEPPESSLRISNGMNQNMTSSNFMPLKNGEAVIFQRLFHSIKPISKRLAQRITINIFY